MGDDIVLNGVYDGYGIGTVDGLNKIFMEVSKIRDCCIDPKTVIAASFTCKSCYYGTQVRTHGV